MSQHGEKASLSPAQPLERHVWIARGETGVNTAELLARTAEKRDDRNPPLETGALEHVQELEIAIAVALLKRYHQNRVGRRRRGV